MHSARHHLHHVYGPGLPDLLRALRNLASHYMDYNDAVLRDCGLIQPSGGFSLQALHGFVHAAMPRLFCALHAFRASENVTIARQMIAWGLNERPPLFTMDVATALHVGASGTVNVRCAAAGRGGRVPVRLTWSLAGARSSIDRFSVRAISIAVYRVACELYPCS